MEFWCACREESPWSGAVLHTHCHVSDHWRTCEAQMPGPYPPSFWFSSSGTGPGIYIFSKFLGDIDTVGPGTIFWGMWEPHSECIQCGFKHTVLVFFFFWLGYPVRFGQWFCIVFALILGKNLHPKSVSAPNCTHTLFPLPSSRCLYWPLGGQGKASDWISSNLTYLCLEQIGSHPADWGVSAWVKERHNIAWKGNWERTI